MCMAAAAAASASCAWPTFCLRAPRFASARTIVESVEDCALSEVTVGAARHDRLAHGVRRRLGAAL